MRGGGARSVAALAAAAAMGAFAAALWAPSAPQADGGAEPVRAALQDAEQPAAITSTAPPRATQEAGAPPPAGRAAGPYRTTLASAPRELIAFAVACGDLRAIEPRRGSPTYRLGRQGNACAPGWAPDGRLAVVAPVGRPPGSVSGLRLLGRDGTVEEVRVPGRSISGRPAFWPDGAIDVCAVSRRAPYHPAIYRHQPGAVVPSLLTEGCFPAISRRAQLAYAAAPDPDRATRRGLLTEVRVLDRDGRLLQAVPLAGSIVDLQWTGDGSRVVAVTIDDGTSEVVSVAHDGRVERLVTAPEGALSIYAAPTGRDVAIVRTRPDAGVSVTAVDAVLGTARWRHLAQGVTRVAWRPSGSVALLADRRRWWLVDREDGRTIASLARLGGAPAWCCPAAASPAG